MHITRHQLVVIVAVLVTLFALFSIYAVVGLTAGGGVGGGPVQETPASHAR
jgi:hypothetical protein